MEFRPDVRRVRFGGADGPRPKPGMVLPKSIEYQEFAKPSWPTGRDRVGRMGAPLVGPGFQNNPFPIRSNVTRTCPEIQPASYPRVSFPSVSHHTSK